jgi:DNA gyrase/topoisomerase IV subunit A
MTLLDQDLPWLLSEASNDPETGQRIVEALAQRVQTLQRQSDELRAENAMLKRIGGPNAAGDQVQRLKTNLRDLRQLAARSGLDREVVTMLSFSGYGVQLPAPAPFEQTLPLLTASDEPVSMLKPVYLAHGMWLSSVLAITSSLRLALVGGYSLPLSQNTDWRDARPAAALGLGRAERVEAMMAVDELQPPRDVLMVTRQGWVRVMSWSLVENFAASGQSLPLPGQDANTSSGDTPVWLGAYETDGDLLLLTRNGRWTRFPADLIPSVGCLGITLDSDDDVVSAVMVGKVDKADAALLFVGADGTLFVISVSGLEPHKRPGAKAVPLARRFIGLTAFVVSARKTDALLVLSNQGEFHIVSMKGMPIATRPSEVQPLKAAERLIGATML